MSVNARMLRPLPLLIRLLRVRIAAAQSGSADTRSWTTQDDHRHLMAQLGIRALRPGPSGNESAPNHANYDEALANPPVNQGLLGAQVAWRQHVGGHTDAPDWTYLLAWADHHFGRVSTPR